MDPGALGEVLRFSVSPGIDVQSSLTLGMVCNSVYANRVCQEVKGKPSNAEQLAQGHHVQKELRADA